MMNRLSPFISFIEQKKAAIFFGAGISKIAGCSGLRDICRKLSGIKSVQELIKSHNPDAVPRKELIAFCKSICNRCDNDRRIFDGIMRQGLTFKADEYYRDYLPFIRKLKQVIPFPSIMTTNVDDCLAKTGQFDLTRIFYKESDMRIELFRDIGIFHIHGYVEDSGGQLWDLFDYPERYGKENFKEFIINTFKEYSILFLGYGFGDDDELKQLMGSAKKETEQPKKHYALLPTNEEHPHVNDAMYDELFNVQILRYGSKADFLRMFGDWIDSNFNPAKLGKDEDVSHLPSISEGASR